MTHEINWTSIKDSLLPVGEPLIVTIIDSIKNCRRELRYPVFYQDDCFRLNVNKYNDIVFRKVEE